MPMPNRTYSLSSSKYRFSINGQEKDNEVYGEGNLTSALFWEYDTRIGRRWNVDPDLDEFLSSYHAFANNPIFNVDPDGDHQYRINENGKIQKTKTKDKFDEFFLLKDSDGDGVKTWERVAKFDKNDKGFIAMPKEFSGGSWGFKYTGSKSENYISGEAMAGVLGTLSNANLTVSFNHWSNSDGSSPSPSRSHKKGTVGDLRPIRKDRSGDACLVSSSEFDKEANTRFVQEAKKFGWTSILSERHNGWITPGTTHYRKTARHNNHYHLQRFKPMLETTNDLLVAPPPVTIIRYPQHTNVAARDNTYVAPPPIIPIKK